jgi:signal transduction histidine kinase/PleD family two-component response regulator
VIQKTLAEPSHRAPVLEGTAVRVLHVGRHTTDVDRARRQLRGHATRFAVDGVLTVHDWLRRAADERFDVLLVDEGASDGSALELLVAARARRLDAPVIVLFGESDDRAAFEAAKLGVYDYLVKRTGDLAKLPLILENAAVRRRLTREREEFAVLSRFQAAVGASLDLSQVGRQVVEAARDLLRTERNLLLLLENGDTLVPAAWTGMRRPGPDVRLPADVGVWAELLADDSPRRLDADALSGPWGPPAGLDGAEAVFGMPLLAKGRPLGVLLSASSAAHRVLASDEALMRALGGHAAVAVENARLVEQLLHAERLSTVGRMVAGVAHELNNPLAVILGTLDLVRHEALEPRLADRIGRVSRQAQRAVKIVRTLLALARKRPAQRRPVDVNELLVATLELTAYDPRHAAIEVVPRFTEALPAVMADADQLQQVFTNLFLNASQAMREAQGQGTLTITTALDPAGGVAVTLADSGPGIKPEHLPYIFEPFFTTKIEGQGTGLGLAICRRIVESHGGRIAVESRPGAGTCFSVVLPVPPDAPRAEPAAGIDTIAPVGAQDVLLIEDDPLVGDMMADILAVDGHRVDRAMNGREALSRVGTRPYALVVSDVRMPDINGPAFYEELRRRDPALARRVVFVTGDVVSPETRQFLDETGVLYLEKPFALTDFKAAVARALATA